LKHPAAATAAVAAPTGERVHDVIAASCGLRRVPPEDTVGWRDHAAHALPLRQGRAIGIRFQQANATSLYG
jgi:hypothetical protein